MVLAIDIGNTHILLGCFEDRKILFTELLSTDRSYTDLEYASLIKSALEFNVAAFEDIEGAIISSVVPSVTGTIISAVERFAKVVCSCRHQGIRCSADQYLHGYGDSFFAHRQRKELPRNIHRCRYGNRRRSTEQQDLTASQHRI